MISNCWFLILKFEYFHSFSIQNFEVVLSCQEVLNLFALFLQLFFFLCCSFFLQWQLFLFPKVWFAKKWPFLILSVQFSFRYISYHIFLNHPAFFKFFLEPHFQVHSFEVLVSQISEYFAHWAMPSNLQF